ncbi:pentatricopeptide repeat-containing protein At4g25270, chloroplastic [Helianthus annuus]|uniref:pentatricopeptide repeat-containing protein At4g25270, chloroplastic n=1 Tax=Helianthus annuus TaxID=4232 RepID=UPI000B906CA4|nr:pentatricopeptide repeat-containing protein At4g25270, chloroplastic [Helianthus annuus]
MAIGMHYQLINTFCLNKDTNKKPNRKQQTQFTQLSFPKSSPTQLLLTHQNPSTQTKLEALYNVVQDLETSVKNGINIDDPRIFSSLLETCYRLQAIELGIRIHRVIPTKLLRRNAGVSSKLLRLYASNGYMEDAHQVFDVMYVRNSSAFVWNSLISGYSEMGLYDDALALYFQMIEEGVEPDGFTFPRVLKACGGMGLIRVGQEVHREIIRRGYANDRFVLNGLVGMYAKCGDIMMARKMFDKIVLKDIVSWNSMLAGFVKHDMLFDALVTFRQMMLDGFEPDAVSISTILTPGLPEKLVAEIHAWVIRKGTEWNLPIANSLIYVYSNNGRLDRARQVFDQMPERDLVSWNSIISVHNKHPNALMYFQLMLSANMSPDTITFVSVLTACAHLRLVKEGERLFSTMTDKYGINPSMEHYACLVNLYGRAGLIVEAYKVITDKMKLKAGPTVWGALLHACYVHGNVEIGEIAAENLFELEPDNNHNFKLLMQIYGEAGRVEDVERVRTMMVSRGFDL